MSAELRLFGGASLFAENGQLVSGAAAQPRRAAVLAVLAEAWPLAVSRDRIIGLIWPEQDEAGARRLLTQALYELRRELGDFTRSASRDISIDAELLTVDVIQFRQALADGDEERAVALHRGQFLDGFHLRGAGEFERWVDAVRDGTTRELLRALRTLVARYEAEAQWAVSARWAEQLVSVSPFDAEAVARAMQLHERAGDPAASLRLAYAYQRRMREELGVEPDDVIARRAEEMRAAIEPAPESRVVPPVVIEAVTLPVATQPVERRRRRRVPAWASVAMGAVVIIAAAGLTSLRAHETSARTLAVVPFEMRGDSVGGDLAPAIAGMLSASLDGANGVIVDSTGTPHDGSFGKLTGVVVNAGHEIRIDAELQLVGVHDAPRRATVSGSRDSVIALTERLSMELLPALYGNSAKIDAAFSRRFKRAATLRSYLDGESALRRGAFDAAHDAFSAVTSQDSSLAYAWYRRALAAEDAHRVADADRSAAIAVAGSANLVPKERQLIAAYAAWRVGETWRADSLYRRVVETAPAYADAWFQFAELAYHGGPLIGRQLDGATDAWRRVVAMDSANFPALMHAVRMEARAGDASAVDALLRRAEAMGANEPFLSEARVIGTLGRRSGARGWDNDKLLDAMPDASVHFVHAIVAGFREDPALAEPVARRLTMSSRPNAVRTDGHVALAHLALARGAWHEAMAQLDSVARDNPAAATWWRAYFATLPFVAPGDSTLAAVETQLRAAPAQGATAPLYLELAVDSRAAPVIARYDLALLELARSNTRGASAFACSDVVAGVTHDLCEDLARGVSAERLRRNGKASDALREVESMTMRVPYQFAGRSAYFARTRERFLRAQLLEQAGRLDDAYQWYAAAPQGGRLDYLYLAPSHLGRGRILERKGDRAGAARHYRKVIELWMSPDVEAGSVRRDAEAGLARVTR